MSPLETVQDGINNWLHEVQVHLMGKGIMTAAVMTAGVLGTLTGMVFVPFVIAIGGVGLHMFYRLRNQWNYQDQMAAKYKEEIGAQLGIDPNGVTREHVKMAAYGNEEQGIEGNRILEQALDRQRSKSWLVFGTAMLAALVTFTLLSMSGLGIAGMVGESLVGLFHLSTLPPALGFVSNLVGMMGGAVIAGASSLFIQDGLELLIGAKTGIAAPSAHDRITAIEARHARGKTITPEQVFQVKLSYASELESRVQAMAGKPFHALKGDMQERVLARIDTKGEMAALANEINQGHIDATELAFVLTGQQTVHRDKACAEPSYGVTRKSFAERLGLKPHTEKHADRIEESRVVPIESARG